MSKFFNFIKTNWALLAILLLALFFRFWQINTLPAGLFPDEAANGLDINSILAGDIQPFYERGNGREAMFFYAEALSVFLFGRGVWQFHVVSALFGFLSVIASYFLTKRMFGTRIALLATFFMAVSSYAVTVTRTAFRATTVPLLATLTLLFLVKFFQAQDKKSKYWSALLAGIFFGLGFYTYTSFRMMLPLVLGFLFLIAVGFRHELKNIFIQYAKYKATFTAGFLVAIAWIASYFIRHPGSFVGRSGQVSVFNPDLNNGDLLGTIIDVFTQTILAFFVNGDVNWRHNISGYPFLSPFISVFFAIGLVLGTLAFCRLLAQVWRKQIQNRTVFEALVAVWFWFMLVPEITTAEGIPHGLRLIGVIPPTFILAALGLAWVWRKISVFAPMFKYKYYFAVFFMASVFLYNFNLYFVIAGNSMEYYYAYRSDLTEVSNYLNQRNQKEKTYLSLDKFSVQTVDFLTTDTNRPFILLDPANTYQVTLEPGDQVIFTQSTIYDRQKFKQAHPNAKLVKELKNRFGQLIMLVYEQP